MKEDIKPEHRLMYAIFGATYCQGGEEDFHESINGIILRHALLGALASFDIRSNERSFLGRDAEIIKMRFGLDDGRTKTLNEVAGAYGVTADRIRQIEARGLRKLRHPSRSRILRHYIKEAS